MQGNNPKPNGNPQQNNNSPLPTSQHLPKYVATLVQQLAATEKWSLTSKKKSFEELQLILNNMPHHNKAKYIYLQWNKMPDLLSPLSNCQFHNLKGLTLGGNNIQSIQSLSKSCLPQLEELWLWNNKLTNTRPLKKMLTPFLRVIDLSSNLLSDATGFTECHFNHLENINLENNRFAEINSLVKLESQLLRLKADIINNQIPSILRFVPKDGRRVATYFYIRHCTVIYC